MDWRKLVKFAALGALVVGTTVDDGPVQLSPARAEEPAQDTHRLGPLSTEMLQRLDSMPDYTDRSKSARLRALPANVADYFTCAVAGYGDVQPTPLSTLNNLAVAERQAGSNTLVIYVNPQRMAKLPPIMQLFWLKHECAHHQLGHTQVAAPLSDVCAGMEEDAADCDAIVSMARMNPPVLDANRVKTILASMRKVPGGGIYRPGLTRAELIEACRTNPTFAEDAISAQGCQP